MIAFEKFTTLCRLWHTYCAHLQIWSWFNNWCHRFLTKEILDLECDAVRDFIHDEEVYSGLIYSLRVHEGLKDRCGYHQMLSRSPGGTCLSITEQMCHTEDDSQVSHTLKAQLNLLVFLFCFVLFIQHIGVWSEWPMVPPESKRSTWRLIVIVYDNRLMDSWESSHWMEPVIFGKFWMLFLTFGQSLPLPQHILFPASLSP